jgi:regulator of protease activity HflC (stomatin/prohibitin superfamily)
MADITRALLLRHLRGTPTTHVRHLRRGKVVHDGTGLSFWFRPLTAVLSELPVDDRELPLMFHARTSDFQDVTVQASVTYRIADPALTASRVDFSISPVTGRWSAAPLEQIGGLLTETAQQHSLALLARTSLADALSSGALAVREQVADGLAADRRLTDTGIDVIAVRVVAIRPEPEMEKALRTPARELVQQDADRATYERRARAVERERTISENEMQSKIELARREEQLVTQRGANARRQAEEAAAANRTETEAQASRAQRLGDARAHAARVLGEATAATEAARVNAYRDLPEATLLGLAVKELAASLPQIGTLVLTPDLLTPLLTRLATGTGRSENVAGAPESSAADAADLPRPPS